MSTTNPKPLTQDEIATNIRRQLKKLNDKTSSQEDKNQVLYSISVLTDLYAKVSINK
jgi:hypothetical protein